MPDQPSCEKCKTSFSTKLCPKCNGEQSKRWYESNHAKALKMNRDSRNRNLKKVQERDRKRNRLKKYSGNSSKEQVQSQQRIKEWREVNVERFKEINRIASLVRSGAIKKPTRCPQCERETLSLKMRVQMDENFSFTGFLCTICIYEKVCRDNDLRRDSDA